MSQAADSAQHNICIINEPLSQKVKVE